MKSQIRTVLRGLLFAPLLAAAPVNPATNPFSRMDLPWWRQRFEAKQTELAQMQPDLIFLGDSITQDWELAGPEPWRDFKPGWEHYYGHRRAINLGFKGDTTASLLWRMRHGELSNIAPRAAVVLIGANNFGRVHWDAAQTVAGIRSVIDELHHTLPQTHVILVSILPSERSAWISENTERANAMLSAQYKTDSGVTWIDATSIFQPNGRLDRGLFLDAMLTPPDPLLHPNAEGQQRLAAIEPAIAAALGEQPR